MIIRKFILAVLLAFAFKLEAQEINTSRKLFKSRELALAAIFQNFALPFYDIGSNFTHPGVKIGMGGNLNSKENLWLSAEISAYRNSDMGNGHWLGSQFSYRPNLPNYIQPTMNIGLTWLKSYHPVNIYRWENGEWTECRKGKSQLLIPIGIGLEYKKNNSQPKFKPFVSYQIMPALFFNDILPISFYTLFEAGIKYKIK